MKKKKAITLAFVLWACTASAQFSGTSPTEWVYREGPLSIGRDSQYPSTTIDKLHIDHGGFRLGSGIDSEERRSNMMYIGDSRYISIGEWYSDDHLTIRAKQGYNFVDDFSRPYYSDIYMYVAAQRGDIGLAVTSDHTYPYQYGVISAVNRDDSKGLAVINTSNTGSQADGEDVFRVYGNGNVECKRVKVATDIWADFVFAEGYRLSGLEETERFIREHGHLPGIPRLAEVREKGIDLGEMDRLLLQKIEELTLHTIEQQRQLDRLMAMKPKHRRR